MNLNTVGSWVEEIAFGRHMPKMTSCLGLYLGSDVIFLSEIRLQGSRPVVEHLLRIPVPPPALKKEAGSRLTGTLNTEILADFPRLVGFLRQAMSQLQWGSKSMVVSLSHHFGLLRYFAMPSIERRFWRTAIPAEAKKYIPIPFNDLVIGFEVIPLPMGLDQRQRIGVLFGVTHRKNLEAIQSLVRDLGCTLVSVELSPCSVERLWDFLDGSQSDSPPYTMLYFQEQTVRMLTSIYGVPVFFREINLGADPAIVDRRKLDLTGSIEFVRKQLGAPKPAQVRLEGSPDALAAWKEAVTQETGIPVRVQNTAKALDLKVGEWGGYASVGCALRPIAPTTLKLDLHYTGDIGEAERRAIFTLFGSAALVAAFFIMVSLVRYGMIFYKSDRFAKLQRQTNSVEAFRGKSSKEIEKIIHDMEDRASTISSFLGGQLKLAEIMEDLADNAPSGLWLTQIGYAGRAGNENSQSLRLAGNVKDRNVPTEQDIVIQFGYKLQSAERLSKAFSCAGPSVQVKSQYVGGGGGSGSPGEKADDVIYTGFTIDCTANKKR